MKCNPENKPVTKQQKNRYSFLLFICSIVIFTIDFVYNLFRSGISADMDLLSWIYYIPAAIGQATCFAVLAYLIFYLPWRLIIKNNRVVVSIYTVFLILLQIFLVADGLVFSLYRFHFNGFIFGMIFGGGTQIFEITAWVYIKFILLALATGVLPMLISNVVARRFHKKLTRKKIVIVWVIISACLIIAHLGHAAAAAAKQPTIQKSAKAMPYFYPLTANKLMNKLGIVDREDIDNINSKTPSTDLQYPINPLEVTDSIPNYNIVYILIDSWNISTFDSIVTPRIYEFANKHAQIFNNHYSSSSGTRGSVMGLFFGIPFIYERALSISKTTPVIIDRLQQAQYNIATFPSATLTKPPFHELIFRNVPNINLGAPGATAFDRDNHIANSYKNYIKDYEKNEPFFSFVFFDLPHAINIPAEHRTKFQPSWDEANYLGLSNSMDRTPFFNLYKNCVYYTDKLIGDLLDDFQAAGMLENTVIIISGDHGQEFNENKRNYWGHGSNFTKWQVQVPFIMFYPGITAGNHYEHMTTHYDVSPTIMKRFLGVTNAPEQYSMGYDMYDTTSRYPHIVGSDINYGFIFENRIVTTNHLGTMEITDSELNPLKRGAVTGEQLQNAIVKRNRFYK